MARTHTPVKDQVDYVNLIGFSPSQIVTNITLDDPKISRLNENDTDYFAVGRDMLAFYQDSIYIHEFVEGSLGNNTSGQTYSYLAKYDASTFEFQGYFDVPLYTEDLRINQGSLWFNPLIYDPNNPDVFTGFPGAGINFGGFQTVSMNDLNSWNIKESVLQTNDISTMKVYDTTSNNITTNWDVSNSYDVYNDQIFRLIYNNFGTLGQKLIGYSITKIKDYTLIDFLPNDAKFYMIYGMLVMVSPAIYYSVDRFRKKKLLTN